MEKAKLQVLGLLKTPWLPCIQNTMYLDQPTKLPPILTFGWDNASCVCNSKYSHLDLTMWVVCAISLLTFGSDIVSCMCNFKYSHLDLTMWVVCAISLLTFGSDNVSCMCNFITHIWVWQCALYVQFHYSHLDLTMWVVYVEMTSQRKLDRQLGWWQRMVKPNIHWIKKFSKRATPKNNTLDWSILLQRTLDQAALSRWERERERERERVQLVPTVTSTDVWRRVV